MSLYDKNKLDLWYFTADNIAHNDVAQADNVVVNDLSLNKRENKNIILIIFKLHVSFYYGKTMTWHSVTCHLMPRHTMTCHLMTCHGP